MRFLCSVFVDEEKLASLSPEELEKLDCASLDYDDALRQGGHLLAAQALQPVASGRTVRRQGEKISITDGPFAEAREQIGGFLLIEASDLDQAVELASRIPPLRLGRVEVRPVKELRRSS